MKFKTALVLNDILFRKVRDVLIEGGFNTEISRYKGFESFKNDEESEFSLLIYAFKKVNEAREVLSYFKTYSHNIQVVLIYPENEISKSDIKNLIVAGAAGLVPETNLNSLFQHIIQVQDLYQSKANNSIEFDELFKNYFDESDSLISLINSDLKYETVNESFTKFHKLEREELVGLCPSDLWGKEVFNSKIESNLRKCLDGEVIRYKAYFDQSGSYSRCYDVVYRPFYPKDSEKPFSLVETKDVSDIEESLKEASDALNRNYYYEKYLPYGIFECNSSGEIIMANETFYNILELPANKREGANILTFTRDDNRFSAYMDDVQTGESSTFSHMPMSTACGTDIFTRISCHARTGVEGEVIMNATLEDNTREVLLERKLSQTQRIETLGTLAGGIAHDFNTILTTISGYSELTLDEVSPDSSIYGYMTRVLNTVNHAGDIVNQMLTFSRQMDIEQVPVKVEEVVKEVCNFMQSALPNNILLNLDIKEIDAHAIADPTQLFRVFLNIMTNSMQSMEGKGGELKVSTFPSTNEERTYANIAIGDTGFGIDKDIIDRIYEPFFTTKNAGGGSGMGLSVAHGIISGLGGEINVESSKGVGTTFIIKIPVYEPVELSQLINPKRSGSGTVFYADNDVYFSRTVSHALERLGYDVKLASSVEEIDVYLQGDDREGEIIFFRCNIEDEIKNKVLNRIIEEKSKARIVLITRPGSSNYRSITKIDRERISVLNEPVNLKDIVNSIQNSC